MTRLRTPVRAVVALVVAALLGAACSRPSPVEELTAAIEATLAEPVGFELAVEADERALERFGPEADRARELLAGTKISGRRQDGAVAVTVMALGLDAVELRSFPSDELYVRVAPAMLSLVFADVNPASLGAAFVEVGLPDEVVTAVETFLDGGWIGVRGDIDPASLDALAGPTPGPPPSGRTIRDALGDSPRAFIERFVRVDALSDRDGSRRFAVELRTRALLDALAPGGAPAGRDATSSPSAAVPGTVDGTVSVRDGRVSEMRLALAGLAEAPGDAVVGGLDLVLDVDPAGELAPVEVPSDAAIVTAEQLTRATRLLLDPGP